MAIELKRETRIYKITGLTPILGSCPANPEIYSTYVANQIEEQKAEMEARFLPEQEIEEKGMTVFMRYSNGGLCVHNHVIKGFFKEALRTLKDQLGLKATDGKVDNFVFVSPEFITFRDDNGALYKEPDSYNERPLRANTMQGPRTSLAKSEQLHEGWTLEFSVTLFPGIKTAKSDCIEWDDIEAALAYGAYKGLGQWRNASWGSFTFERVE